MIYHREHRDIFKFIVLLLFFSVFSVVDSYVLFTIEDTEKIEKKS